ncbi:cytochrome P450 [Mycena polygramma]|nr:cytochrome P450 [Mycena polygramma]
MAYAIAAGLLFALLFYIAHRYSRRSDDDIPGPTPQSWLWGNLLQLLLPENLGDYEFQWQKQFGLVYNTHGCFGEKTLVVADPLAIQAILNNPAFSRAPALQQTLTALFGENSLACSSGQTHRHLRAAMSPAFAPLKIRRFLPVFEKAASMIEKQWQDEASRPLNICSALNLATLRVINEGCEKEDPQLREHHMTIVSMASKRSKTQVLIDAVIRYLPPVALRVLLNLPSEAGRVLENYRTTTRRIGTKQVEEDMQTVGLDAESQDSVFRLLVNGKLGKPNLKTETELSGPEIIATQTTMFVFAGQDTTAITLSFALDGLAKDPQFQAELRREVCEAYTESEESDGDMPYERMPLLNALIKETLRLYPAVSLSNQVAVEDTVLPLTHGITSRSGKHLESLPVKKGQSITVSVAGYHRSETHWGPDAHEFRPRRWLELEAREREAGKGGWPALGPYAHLLSFWGGPRTCIGWRFALLELQVILAHLVRTFTFALPADAAARARPCLANVTLLPMMRDGRKGLPLVIERVRPVNSEEKEKVEQWSSEDVEL